MFSFSPRMSTSFCLSTVFVPVFYFTILFSLLTRVSSAGRERIFPSSHSFSSYSHVDADVSDSNIRSFLCFRMSASYRSSSLLKACLSPSLVHCTVLYCIFARKEKGGKKWSKKKKPLAAQSKYDAADAAVPAFSLSSSGFFFFWFTRKKRHISASISLLGTVLVLLIVVQEVSGSTFSFGSPFTARLVINDRKKQTRTTVRVHGFQNFFHSIHH